ncbi:MAG: hypothetical protein ACW981_21170 [Candidatus Hodarchaeales archaeon]|jgi:hypothetical protein
MAVIIDKKTKNVRLNKHFYKISQKINNSIKKALSWILNGLKNVIHLVLYQKNEMSDKILEKHYIEYQTKIAMNHPNVQPPRIIR